MKRKEVYAQMRKEIQDAFKMLDHAEAVATAEARRADIDPYDLRTLNGDYVMVLLIEMRIKAQHALDLIEYLESNRRE